MAFEIRELQGSLFKNDRKEQPSHPDYQGQVRIAGKLYRISGWKRQSAKGTVYLSLSFKPDEREDVQERRAPAAAAVAGNDKPF